jgi:hypothetical protein
MKDRLFDQVMISIPVTINCPAAWWRKDMERFEPEASSGWKRNGVAYIAGASTHAYAEDAAIGNGRRPLATSDDHQYESEKNMRRPNLRDDRCLSVGTTAVTARTGRFSASHVDQ